MAFAAGSFSPSFTDGTGRGFAVTLEGRFRRTLQMGRLVVRQRGRRIAVRPPVMQVEGDGHPSVDEGHATIQGHGGTPCSPAEGVEPMA